MINTKPSKLFETIMVWLISLCLISNILLMLKIGDLLYKLRGTITDQTDFVSLVSTLSEKTKDLKDIEILMLIYRSFLFLLIIIFAFFILYRIVSRQYNKLLQANTVMIWVSTMAISIYVYISKDLFYALKIIVDKKYQEGFQTAMYLLGRVQVVIDRKDVFIFLTILIFISNLLAIILNIRAILGKDDESHWKKFNMTIFISALVILISISGYNRYLRYSSSQFKPFKYMVLNYSNKGEDIYLVGSINLRLVNKNTIDPAIRNFYLTGVNYEIENSNEKLILGEKRKINVSYDSDSKKELGLKGGKLEKTINIDIVPKIVNDINEIDIDNLYSYLLKYDARYIDSKNIDDITGIYEQRKEEKTPKYYLLEKLDQNQLSFSEKRRLGENNQDLYKLIYLGIIYRNNKEVVGLEALNNIQASQIYTKDQNIEKLLDNASIIKVK